MKKKYVNKKKIYADNKKKLNVKKINRNCNK